MLKLKLRYFGHLPTEPLPVLLSPHRSADMGVVLPV